jgi:hypothetical protein
LFDPAITVLRFKDVKYRVIIGDLEDILTKKTTGPRPKDTEEWRGRNLGTSQDEIEVGVILISNSTRDK